MTFWSCCRGDKNLEPIIRKLPDGQEMSFSLNYRPHFHDVTAYLMPDDADYVHECKFKLKKKKVNWNSTGINF